MNGVNGLNPPVISAIISPLSSPTKEWRITLKIAIESWCCWPAEASSPATSSYFSNGEYGSAQFEKPVVENVPPMQKRRLSRLARVVFHVLDFCADEDSQSPVVFSSVMGEIQRTQGILDTLAKGEAVSPAAFSLSVHNSIAGLWSLIRGNKAAMLALAPPSGSPVTALLEAAGMLAEGGSDAVNVVFYDEGFPAFYHPFLQGPAAPYALALKLVCPDTASDSAIVLSLSQQQATGAAPHWQSPAELLSVLGLERQSTVIPEPNCSWRLERAG